MKKMPNSIQRRSVAIFIKKYRPAEFIIAVLTIVLGIASFVTFFVSEKPMTSIGMGGEAISPYTLFNIFSILFVVFFIILLVIFTLWLFTKNASPFVQVKDYQIGDTAHIKIINYEPTDLTDIRIKIVGFSMQNNYFSSKFLGENRLIEITKTIINKAIDVPIVIGKHGFTIFLFDEKENRFFLNDSGDGFLKGKYEIVLEISVRIIDEREWRQLGTYYGIISHTRLSWMRLIGPGKDVLGYIDEVEWVKESFRKLGKKDNSIIMKLSTFS